jgi:uncharacterized membrane protein
LDNYLALKLLHIISAVVVAGTGFGIAYFMYMASRSQDSRVLAVTTRLVVLADWLFTTPAIVLQLVTGILLMRVLGYSFTSRWFAVVITLYTIVGACWIPVVLIQYRLRDLAPHVADDAVTEQRWRRLMRRWIALGIPAFTAVLVLFWMMVFKPLPTT